MKIKKLASFIATGALVLGSFAPAAFASAVEISGNGAFSSSTGTVADTSTKTAVQTNTSTTTNTITNTQDTGHNTADFNTGGDVSLTSGSTLSRVDVSNMSNLNKLDNGGSSFSGGSDSSALISGNGAFSSNAASLSSQNDMQAFQTNSSSTTNDISNAQNTGNNNTGYNTGGNVSLRSGDSQSLIMVKNMSNANSLGAGGMGNGLTAVTTPGMDFGSHADIAGNGAYSSNTATISQDNTAVLDQTNSDSTTNDISNSQTTGENSSDYNTGGNTSVRSGFADSRIGIDNMANFNAAGTFGEGFNSLTDASGFGGAILSNGYGSENSVSFANESTRSAFQTNSSTPVNNIANTFDTGFNENSDNTGSLFGTVTNRSVSGDSMEWTRVSNTNNVNSLGGLDLPHLNFSFDLGALGSILSL